MRKVRPPLGEIMEVIGDPRLEVTPLLLVCKGSADTENIFSDWRVRRIPRTVLRLTLGRPAGVAQVFLLVLPNLLPALLHLSIVVLSDDLAFCDVVSVRSLDEINSAILASTREAMQLRMFWQE